MVVIFSMIQHSYLEKKSGYTLSATRHLERYRKAHIHPLINLLGHVYLYIIYIVIYIYIYTLGPCLTFSQKSDEN